MTEGKITDYRRNAHSSVRKIRALLVTGSVDAHTWPTKPVYIEAMCIQRYHSTDDVDTNLILTRKSRIDIDVVRLVECRKIPYRPGRLVFSLYRGGFTFRAS